jgi:hypothetical protein
MEQNRNQLAFEKMRRLKQHSEGNRQVYKKLLRNSTRNDHPGTPGTVFIGTEKEVIAGFQH